jgi:hypothetical protein
LREAGRRHCDVISRIKIAGEILKFIHVREIIIDGYRQIHIGLLSHNFQPLIAERGTGLFSQCSDWIRTERPAVRFSAGARDFYLSYGLRIGQVCPSVSCAVDTGGYFPWVKAQAA